MAAAVMQASQNGNNSAAQAYGQGITNLGMAIMGGDPETRARAMLYRAQTGEAQMMMQQNALKAQAMQAVQALSTIKNPDGTAALDQNTLAQALRGMAVLEPRLNPQQWVDAANTGVVPYRDQAFKLQQQNNEAAINPTYDAAKGRAFGTLPASTQAEVASGNREHQFRVSEAINTAQAKANNPDDPAGVEANFMKTLNPDQLARYIQFKNSKMVTPGETMVGAPVPGGLPEEALPSGGAAAPQGNPNTPATPLKDQSHYNDSNPVTGLGSGIPGQVTTGGGPSVSLPQSLPQAASAGVNTVGPVTLAQSAFPKAPSNIPAEGQKSIMDNIALIQRLDQAKQLVSAHPDALGVKNLLPGASFFENLYGSPENNQTRAALNGLTMSEMHDQFGARLTNAEYEKSAASIANTSDTAQNALNKLNLMRGAAQRETTNLAQMFSPQAGYVVPTALANAIGQYSTSQQPTASAPGLQVPGGPNPSTAPQPPPVATPALTPMAAAVTGATTPAVANAGPATAVANSVTTPPSVSPAPTSMAAASTGVMNTPGAVGLKQIDPQTAAQILQRAGGDPVQARQMATQAGFQF